MRVASEQASGEKYRSMDASLAVARLSARSAKVESGFAGQTSPFVQRSRASSERAGVDFYTVPHNINRVKEFIAKWYKKIKTRHRRRKSKRLSRRNAAAVRAPISQTSHSAKRSISSARTALRRLRSMISAPPPA